MYLSFSGWKTFDEKYGCNYSYWNSYINHTPTGDDDRMGSLFGSAVGKLFEDFYTQEWYRKPQPQGFAVSRVGETIRELIREETTTNPRRSWKKPGILRWKGTGEGQNPKAHYVDEAELAADVRDAVARGFRIIRHYRLLGKDARAEVPLDVTILGHKLGGRADFIMRRVQPYGDLLILDGKGSRYREDYTDKRQLIWYAMLYYERHKILPDKLGFVYWRFDPPKSVDWVPVDLDAIQELKAQVLADIRRIEELTTKATDMVSARRVFLPIAEKPGVDKDTVKQACRFCPFATEDVCPAGWKIVSKMR